MLEDLARETGVSVSTVSRALSGKPGVSEKRRAQIVALARSAGLAPDPAASALRSGKGIGLAVLTPRRQTEVQHHRDYCLFQAAREVFGSVKVVVQNPADNLDGHIVRVIAEKPEAIVLHGVSPRDIEERTVELLRKKRIALVVIDQSTERFDSVEIDRAAGTYQATRMLLLTGAAAPIFFSAADFEAPDARLMGIATAFRSLDRDPAEIQLVRHRHGGYEEGTRLARDLLRLREFDGLFCYNDQLAIGALRGLHQERCDVPAQCRVVGFDDLPVCASLPVSLSTVAQPTDELVDAAVDLLRRRREEPERPRVRLRFPARLKLRESAPVRDAATRRRVFCMDEYERNLKGDQTR